MQFWSMNWFVCLGSAILLYVAVIIGYYFCDLHPIRDIYVRYYSFTLCIRVILIPCYNDTLIRWQFLCQIWQHAPVIFGGGAISAWKAGRRV